MPFGYRKGDKMFLRFKTKRKARHNFLEMQPFNTDRKLLLTAMKCHWISAPRKFLRPEFAKAQRAHPATTQLPVTAGRRTQSSPLPHACYKVFKADTRSLPNLVILPMVWLSAFADLVAQKGNWSPWVENSTKRRSHPLTDRLEGSSCSQAEAGQWPGKFHRCSQIKEVKLAIWHQTFPSFSISSVKMESKEVFHPGKTAGTPLQTSSPSLSPWPQGGREQKPHFQTCLMSTSFVHRLAHSWETEHFTS